MPLKEGSSQATISANMEHCMSNYKETGKVSGNAVGSTEKARKICAAMSYATARKASKGKSLVKYLRKK